MKVKIEIDKVTLTLSISEWVTVIAALKRHARFSVFAKEIVEKLPKIKFK